MPDGRLSRLLGRSTVTLMDGGMGSTVEDRGVPVRNALWGSFSLLTPEGRALTDEIHREFVQAGAEIIIANAHSAQRELCTSFLESDQVQGVSLPEEVTKPAPEERAVAFCRHVNRLAVESARRAVPAGSEVVVAAGAGSPEGPYAETSRMPPAEVVRAHEPQVRCFRDLGVELILFETLTTASEIEGVARLSAEFDLDSFGVGLTCGEDGRTLAGVSMDEAVRVLLPADPAAFFIQCTAFPLVLKPLGELVAALDGRSAAGVYANDGRVWTDMRWHGERTSPEEYADHAERWIEAGARIIGGCCGTGPEHVRELRRRLG